jgi:ADP-ribose pyrophosphatase
VNAPAPIRVTAWGELRAERVIPGALRVMVDGHAAGGVRRVPGGHVELGETGARAAARELAEETALVLSPELSAVMPARYVPDPRASDEAWAVTVPVHVDLGGAPADGLPEVTAGDDARRAEWIPAPSYGVLVAALAGYGGTVFAAHAGMLAEFLDGAR